MSWEATGALAELIGAPVVVVSLIYFTAQVRLNSNQIAQNSKHIEASIYHSTNEALPNWFAILAQDGEAAKVWSKLVASESLEPVEKVRGHALLSNLFLAYEANYQQAKIVIVDRATFDMPVGVELFAIPAAFKWWRTNGPKIFTLDFQAQMEKVIEKDDRAT